MPTAAAKRRSGRTSRRSAEFGPTIVTGFFKFAVIAGLFFELFNWTQAPGNGWPPAVDLALGLLAYAIYLYASFAGYTDIVRGFGGLVGLVPPENFDRPYLSADFLDVWSRWHISLSEWFKLYVFNPLTKALIAVNNRPAVVPYLGAIGFFVTFLLMGLWHGLTPRYALYGLMLGLGVSLNKLYQVAMGQWLGRRGYQALARHGLYAAVARALAVGYFVLALAFLWLVDPATAGTPIDWLAATRPAPFVAARAVHARRSGAGPRQDHGVTGGHDDPAGAPAHLPVRRPRDGTALAVSVLLELTRFR